jgi:mRNA-degrading endonuclease toxin of MazEF toxin-antitoxin module
MEQTGRRPVVIWQSDDLIRILKSVVVIPLTTNADRSRIFGTSIIMASEIGPPEDSVAPGFQIRTIAKSSLLPRSRAISAEELADLESATDEAFGRARH